MYSTCVYNLILPLQHSHKTNLVSLEKEELLTLGCDVLAFTSQITKSSDKKNLIKGDINHYHEKGSPTQSTN